MGIAPTDTLLNAPPLSRATVLDFWFWAFGDLTDDDIKGFFAEWLVQKLLGVESHRRVSWANCDVIIPDGPRIEVKSTARWQSWKYRGEDGHRRRLDELEHGATPDSRIRFSRLKSRDTSSGLPKSEAARDFKADFYVFAFQNEETLDKLNPLDVSQWEFYWVPVEELRKRGWTSIALRVLRHDFERLTAHELATVGRAAIATFRADGRA